MSSLRVGPGAEHSGAELQRQRFRNFESHGHVNRKQFVASQHVDDHLYAFTFDVYRRVMNRWQFERRWALKFNSHGLPLLPETEWPMLVVTVGRLSLGFYGIVG